MEPLSLATYGYTIQTNDPLSHLATYYENSISGSRNISQGWVNEVHLLQHDPPFLKVFNARVVLCTSLQFLPRVTSRYYLNQDITLPVLHPEPQDNRDEPVTPYMFVGHSFYLK